MVHICGASHSMAHIIIITSLVIAMVIPFCTIAELIKEGYRIFLIEITPHQSESYLEIFRAEVN